RDGAHEAAEGRPLGVPPGEPAPRPRAGGRARARGVLPPRALEGLHPLRGPAALRGRAARAAARAVSAKPLPAPAAPGLGGSSRAGAALERARAGERLGREDALVLLADASLLELGHAADEARRRKHGSSVVTYQVDRNVNYTNVCVYRCSF